MHITKLMNVHDSMPIKSSGELEVQLEQRIKLTINRIYESLVP